MISPEGASEIAESRQHGDPECVAALPRFLHTADWQIGKPFRNITDPQKRFRLQQQRILSVSRIAAVAEEHNVDAVLVAGDLFDSSTVPSAVVMEVLEVIGSMNRPVLVIPGNHDHGGAGGVWQRQDVQRQLKERAPLMQLLLKPEPVLIDHALVLPCPLLRQRDSEDPSAWISQLDWQDLAEDCPRIVLAHGAVHGFESTDYNQDSAGQSERINRIDLDMIQHGQVDYVALGDWHNLKQVGDRAWYCGTPEPDRFDQGDQDQRGQVLVFDIDRGTCPIPKSVSTAGLHWHNLRVQLRTTSDLDRLERTLQQRIGSRVGRDLLRLEINGQLSLREYQRFDALIEVLRTQLLHVRIKGTCHRRPGQEELRAMTDRSEDHLISSIALQLQGELENLEPTKSLTTEQQSEAELIELALCELHRLCSESSLNN